MRRRSTGVASASTGTDADTEIKNTGLRPCWDEFWALEADTTSSTRASAQAQDSHTCTISTASTVRSDTNIRSVKFISGSEWIGEWDRLGMNGMGIYKMPHGVIYEGCMNAGLFEGIGVLTYPNGGSLEGFWHEGKLKYCQYEFSDGLRPESPVNWGYCQTPDRRFYTELMRGLWPADWEQMTGEEPTREIPPGMYDVGDGFYNPRTKCVTDPVTGEILRIPTSNEEKWIVENARSADVDNIGYRPDLYENWFKEKGKESEQAAGREVREDERAILEVIQQDGMLESLTSSWRSSQDRSTSLQSKLGEGKSGSSLWSRSTMEFEEERNKLLKEELRKEFSFLEGSVLANDPDLRESDDYSMNKLLQDIALSFSGHLHRVFYSADTPDNISQQPSEQPRQSVKDTKDSSSETSVSTKPFSFTSESPPQEKDASEEVARMAETSSDTEMSTQRLNIDYTAFTRSSTSVLRPKSRDSLKTTDT